ncbi:MAG TPA: hypothetical protein VKH43_11775 [Thermoanaerobaculia bacterium]|nr:hypothetical protein [Thermoanaerobaculia bacterium]
MFGNTQTRNAPALAAVCLLAFVVPFALPGAVGQTSPPPSESREAGLQAWAGIARVLRHPRCMNCHTTTNFPRQGDDRHPHVNLVRRGLDGHGVPGQMCSTCHQTENNESSGVPGTPNWHLAPLSMAWEGLSDADLCRVVTDPKKNGGMDLAKLEEHIEHDPIVAYGWNPGANRKPIPGSRADLIQLMKTWSRAGAPCPSRTASR